MSTKRNGKIELMRFVFCAVVILFHCNNTIGIKLSAPFEFFGRGRIGVEFFFLVSGYFLADSAARSGEVKNIPFETKRFMYKKLRTVLPYHLAVYVICLSLSLAVGERSTKESLLFILDTLPNFFFIQGSGIYRQRLIGPEWYVAAMLITMLIIYPFALRYKKYFTQLACPVIAVLSIGFMIHTDGKLGGAQRWLLNDSFPKAYLRAFAEICGGAFCFELSNRLKRQSFRTPQRIALTAAEILCYAFPLAYTVSNLPYYYEAYAYYSLAAAVTLSLSEVTYFSKCFNNRLIYLLGRLSITLYYTQRIAFIAIEKTPLGDMRVREQLAFCLLFTAVTAVALMPASEKMIRRFKPEQK
ncbi:MAG: acyltransferase [Eubacterium sp.]|nr:acyltransferase [Eubacterium sp.]